MAIDFCYCLVGVELKVNGLLVILKNKALSIYLIYFASRYSLSAIIGNAQLKW